MEITVTIGDLMDKDWWKACDVLGFDEWCVKEGRVRTSDKVTLNEDQAKELGFLTPKNND